jgi:hypothetical protein
MPDPGPNASAPETTATARAIANPATIIFFTTFTSFLDLAFDQIKEQQPCQMGRACFYLTFQQLFVHKSAISALAKCNICT